MPGSGGEGGCVWPWLRHLCGWGVSTPHLPPVLRPNFTCHVTVLPGTSAVDGPQAGAGVVPSWACPDEPQAVLKRGHPFSSQAGGLAGFLSRLCQVVSACVRLREESLRSL